MTEPGSVLLDRVQLERAFTALGERLAQRGVVADVFVVGGDFGAGQLGWGPPASAGLLADEITGRAVIVPATR